MISLSFAFEGDDETLEPIVLQIDLCLKAGISVFAAASNDGGSSGRAFPARQDGVFCIHAGTHDEMAPKINPDPQDGDDNFLVLGCDILSSWPGFNADGSGRKEYKTGTSFAVPVAVSIAAFMVAYISKLEPKCDKWHNKPMSPIGLRKIFQAMVREQKNPTYDWVSPCGFVYENKSTIVSDIRKRLNYSRGPYR